MSSKGIGGAPDNYSIQGQVNKQEAPLSEKTSIEQKKDEIKALKQDLQQNVNIRHFMRMTGQLSTTLNNQPISDQAIGEKIGQLKSELKEKKNELLELTGKVSLFQKISSSIKKNFSAITQSLPGNKDKVSENELKSTDKDAIVTRARSFAKTSKDFVGINKKETEAKTEETEAKKTLGYKESVQATKEARSKEINDYGQSIEEKINQIGKRLDDPDAHLTVEERKDLLAQLNQKQDEYFKFISGEVHEKIDEAIKSHSEAKQENLSKKMGLSPQEAEFKQQLDKKIEELRNQLDDQKANFTPEERKALEAEFKEQCEIYRWVFEDKQ